MTETFTLSQIEHSIKAFLEYGESEEGKSQLGYFSGGGFAARCLRFHFAEIQKASKSLEKMAPVHRADTPDPIDVNPTAERWGWTRLNFPPETQD